MTPWPERNFDAEPRDARDLRVAAVVVTYDRPQELRQVVTALQRQSRPPDHIIVFDNGGDTRAASVLAEDTERVEIVHSETNLGGAGGFSQGLARGLERGVDWVWLLDDDAVPEVEALAQLLASKPAQERNTGALCSGVREFGHWGRRHHRRFGRRTGWERPVAAAAYCRNRVEIDAGSFVSFLVSARAAKAVGLPDADFFLAYDDTDYSLRLRRAGWRLWLIPGSVVVHLRNPASRLHSSHFGEKHYYNIRNRLIVKRRYAELRGLATCEGLGYALVLWILTGGWTARSGWRRFWRAVADGLSARLDVPGK